MVGTVQYMAPEVIDGVYTCIVDCWSVGCIVYRLIAGNDLFKSFGDIYKFKYTGAPSPESALVDRGLCSDDCVKFVANLITVDPSRRLDATAALDHPWILRLSGSAESCKYTISNKLRIRFAGYEALPIITKDHEA